MPAKKPMKTTSSRAIQSVKVQAISRTIAPAPTIATPKMRSRARSRATLGPIAMPRPRPMNTAPKSRPYAASPPPSAVA